MKYVQYMRTWKNHIAHVARHVGRKAVCIRSVALLTAPPIRHGIGKSKHHSSSKGPKRERNYYWRHFNVKSRRSHVCQ
jgi:hypothetical protein